ncbi:hypothetical protein SAMN05216228_106218 [Rhizobium tibeticum]|uniref:Uncharacterized protein n=1 Tax=Rhizobium tibeticum TaxID=501024 RepID=A0A1H8WE86_9HYPH|nr:hypothetical protein RTCCBAU85039_6479 [Rhizobium tibeticum]SEP25879.1 hypothetical protein SAMN05216228_106218 [Rhizobium tibeticum]
MLQFLCHKWKLRIGPCCRFADGVVAVLHYPNPLVTDPDTGLPEVDLQLTTRRRFKPDCRTLLRPEFPPPFPDSKLYRTQTDGNAVLAD